MMGTEGGGGDGKAGENGLRLGKGGRGHIYRFSGDREAYLLRRVSAVRRKVTVFSTLTGNRIFLDLEHHEAVLSPLAFLCTRHLPPLRSGGSTYDIG